MRLWIMNSWAIGLGYGPRADLAEAELEAPQPQGSLPNTNVGTGV
jgi:hypothetical protein